jgi:hypothetical protein
MRHARTEALNQLEDLLTALRALPLLRERSRGVFYWRAQAFIHFHEDPAGLYADLRVGAEFERYPVNTETERGLFWSAVQQALV